MSNADRFLRAFNSIEKWLRSATTLDRHASFSALVDRAASQQPAIRRYSYDLREFADLRNAIVHDDRSDGYIIAEPNLRAVREIESLEALLLSPPKVIPAFQRKVESADSSSPLRAVVSRMSSRHFSQVPVTKDGKFVGVLSTNTIARWLGAQATDGKALLEETTVEQVLDHTECKENHVFVSRSTTLFQVLDRFDQFEINGRSLDAVLITEQGKPTTAFLGVITLYDVPKILGLVGSKRGSRL